MLTARQGDSSTEERLHSLRCPGLLQHAHLDGEPVLIIWTALLTCMACRVLASARLNSLASSGFFAYPT